MRLRRPNQSHTGVIQTVHTNVATLFDFRFEAVRDRWLSVFMPTALNP